MNGTERPDNETRGSSRRVVVRPAPSRPSWPSPDSARLDADRHVFSCGTGLLRAVEARAEVLGCSVEWLFIEGLRRVLDEPAPESVVAAPPRERTTSPLPSPSPPPPPTQARASRREALVPAARARVDTGRIQLRARTSEGTICALVSHLMVVGRAASEVTVHLAHPSVSRTHARFERRAEGWFVVDLASFNGVYVNSVRTRCAPIVPGDVLGIGPFTITVERACCNKGTLAEPS